MTSVPVIDLRSTAAGGAAGGAPADDNELAAQLDAACREFGFFVITGHGLDPALLRDLDAAARTFFALPDETKAAISMDRGGSAWRGWFPLGGELTSGKPDHKEGIYFGSELPPDDRPMHGPNLFPAEPPELEALVLRYLDDATAVGQRVVGLLDRGLGLNGRLSRLVADPLVLFRIFAYPPPAPEVADRWGVGEHTDYGLLTLLLADGTGGLQVRTDDGWLDVPPIAGSLVCNIGDMLERATGGRYRSTPHRARNHTEQLRLSFPLFLDPGWDIGVERFFEPDVTQVDRWDNADPVLFDGPYGDYVWSKVGKVFPALRSGADSSAEQG